VADTMIKAPHRFWPGRECSAPGGQSALQSPRTILDGNHREWLDASAGSLQGGTVGRDHGWSTGWHIPSAKFWAWGRRGTSAIG